MISEMSRSSSINSYLRPFSIAIYEKFNLYFLYLFRLFLACKLYNSGLQIMPLISDHLRFMASADIGGFYYWDITKGHFQFLNTFLAVFFCFVNCKNTVGISEHILDMGNVLLEAFYYLDFRFLAFIRILSIIAIYFF